MGIAGMAGGLAGTEIIARADAALYRAKEAGRDRWSL
jgi:PleD family two-component response regulator